MAKTSTEKYTKRTTSPVAKLMTLESDLWNTKIRKDHKWKLPEVAHMPVMQSFMLVQWTHTLLLSFPKLSYNHSELSGIFLISLCIRFQLWKYYWSALSEHSKSTNYRMIYYKIDFQANLKRRSKLKDLRRIYRYNGYTLIKARKRISRATWSSADQSHTSKILYTFASVFAGVQVYFCKSVPVIS